MANSGLLSCIKFVSRCNSINVSQKLRHLHVQCLSTYLQPRSQPTYSHYEIRRQFNNYGDDDRKGGWNQRGGGEGSGRHRGGGSFHYGGRPRGGFQPGQFNRPQRYDGQSMGRNLRRPDWATQNLQPLKKDFYVEHDDVKNCSPDKVNAFRKASDMTLLGAKLPNPIQRWEEANFPDYIMRVIEENDYGTPTPIQAQGMPIALSGQNMVGIAQTGSGKTMAFIAPGIVHIKNQPPLKMRDGPIGLVVAPTRELAQQIENVAKQFAAEAKIRTTCLFGGVSKTQQSLDLDRGVELCIATPGRLIDFLEMGTTDLSRCTYLVLDEADRMLDMGFEPQIRKIIEQIRPDRQVLMWSATWPEEIKALAHNYLGRDFVQLNVGSLELSANPNITQKVEVIDEFNKESRLAQLLAEIYKSKGEKKTLIFVETKRKAEMITRALKQLDWPVLCLHGDKSQMQRDIALQDFRRNKDAIMVATDVASRGIDVNDIKHVINVDFPQSVKDYVHRIGRTGRCNNIGTSYTFFTVENQRLAKELIEVLKESKQEICPELLELAGARNMRSSNRGSGW